MRVLLVDDEELAIDRLEALFAEIGGVAVVGRAQDGEEALERIAALTPDLVILDVQMPGRNGLRTAADIAVEPRPELVFVTAHEHYAPEAFEVDAADYLLKPVRLDRLRQAVERARRRRAMREAQDQAGTLAQENALLRAGATPAADDAEFWVPERNGLRRVSVDDIAWIEAARDYVLLHTATRSHMLRATMAGLEAKLAGSRLIRVHRSAFVRPERVTEVKRVGRTMTLVLEDGGQVQVGPNYVSMVESVLGI
ncbi:MAG: LytTR family DNA-binding domain-containing protein [Sphingomonas sp.]